MKRSEQSFNVGDQVRYKEGLVERAQRKAQVGRITKIFSDQTSGPLRADIDFDGEIDPGVSTARIEHAL